MKLKDVILRRTRFDLEHAKARLHIVEGLLKAVDILDEIIKTIRASKNKADSIANLVSAYAFTEEQATAIVTSLPPTFNHSLAFKVDFRWAV